MKLKYIKAFIIGLCPTNSMRIFLYNHICGYDIDINSRISAFTLLVVEKVSLNSAYIGPFNIIRINQISMAPESYIGKFNFISNLKSLMLDYRSQILHRNFIAGTYKSDMSNGNETFYLGKNSQISIGCFFDVADYINIGSNVVVGGCNSQFWTHNFDQYKKFSRGPINLGDNIFIGSASILLPNISICSNVLIAAGSVVHRSINNSGNYGSNQLRKIG